MSDGKKKGKKGKKGCMNRTAQRDNGRNKFGELRSSLGLEHVKSQVGSCTLRWRFVPR